MKAAIYCRVSTEDQEREGTSLQSQADACLKKSAQMEYQTSADYTIKEVYSGLSLERPELSRLREGVHQKEVDAVIVYSTDRLSRDPVHLLLMAEEFEKAGAKLIFVTEPLDNSLEGQLLGFVRGWASKVEVIKIRERSIRGRRMRAAMGRIPSGAGRKLYGYDYLPGKGVGEGIRYVNEAEAKWVKSMFSWLVDEALTVNAITRRLRALNVPTPLGSGFWLRQTVHRILSNPAYTGKTYAFTRNLVEPKYRKKPNVKKKTGVQWKPKEEWVEIAGATPPIISQETFEAAQAQLRRNKEMSPRNAKRQYLLSGHIFCARCRRHYFGYVKKWKDNGKRSEQRYYRCGRSQTIVDPHPCDNKQVHAPMSEETVWKQIEEILSRPELILKDLETREHNSQIVSNLEKQQEMVTAQLDSRAKQKSRLWRAFELTGDEETFKRDIGMLGKEIETLEQEKTGLEKRLETTRHLEISADSIKKACKLIKHNSKNLTFEEKRMTLEILDIKVWVDGQELRLEGAIPPLQIGDIVSSASR